MGRAAASAADLTSSDRIIGRVRGDAPGHTLICLGGVHGNEPAGPLGLGHVLQKLREIGAVQSGEIVAIVGNRAALAAGRRWIDRDLNRGWSDVDVEVPHPVAEDLEQRQLREAIQSVAAESCGDVYVLDFHTTSGPGGPFTVFPDTLRCRAFAQAFPTPIVLGLDEHVRGTIVDFLASKGHVAIAFEAGQHENPGAARNVAAAVWIALEMLDMVREQSVHVNRARETLASAIHDVPKVLQIRSRHGISEEDCFAMNEGFGSFDLVRQGQVLATDRFGHVLAPKSGLLLMPLYQEQGDDGFFLVTRVRPLWLTVSRGLRRLGWDRKVHMLPGIQRDPQHKQTIIVNTRVARWLALDLLHLLGFRRLREDGNLLYLQRRQFDVDTQ